VYEASFVIEYGNMEIWKDGNMEIWKDEKMEIIYQRADNFQFSIF
jgi:hypothetical protein